MEIKLKTCTLRPWKTGDEDSLVKHADNYKIWRNVRDRFPQPYTLEDARSWILHASTEIPQTSFAITVAGNAVGGIGIILREDIYRRSAEIGYWLGEEFWGKGIMSDAVRGLSSWAFEQFDIVRLYAGVLEWNPASMRVLEKAGYQFEARLRKAVVKEGVTMDEILYALVREK